jgi:hypothetical protein
VKGDKIEGVKKAKASVIPNAEANPQNIENLEPQALISAARKQINPEMNKKPFIPWALSSILRRFIPIMGGVNAVSRAGIAMPIKVAVNPTPMPVNNMGTVKRTDCTFT